MRGAAGRIAEANNSAAFDSTCDTTHDSVDAASDTAADAYEYAIDTASHATPSHATRGADVNTCTDASIDAGHHAVAATAERWL